MRLCVIRGFPSESRSPIAVLSVVDSKHSHRGEWKEDRAEDSDATPPLVGQGRSEEAERHRQCKQERGEPAGLKQDRSEPRDDDTRHQRSADAANRETGGTGAEPTQHHGKQAAQHHG